MGLFGKKQRNNLVDSLAELEKERSNQPLNSGSSVVGQRPINTPSAGSQGTGASLDQSSTGASNSSSTAAKSQPASVIDGAQINFENDIMTVDLDRKSDGEQNKLTNTNKPMATDSGVSSSIPQSTGAANSIADAAAKHSAQIDEFERMLSEYDAQKAAESSNFDAEENSSSQLATNATSSVEVSASPISTENSLDSEVSVTGFESHVDSAAVTAQKIASASSANVVNPIIASDVSESSDSTHSAQTASTSVKVSASSEGSVQTSSNHSASSQTNPIFAVEGAGLFSQTSESTTPGTQQESSAEDSSLASTKDSSDLDLGSLGTPMGDEEALANFEIPQDSLDSLNDMVSVEAGKDLVSSTITEQYNNVLEQNSLLVSQIEQLQSSNDGLFKQIHKWQEYRSEALTYINQINAQHEDNIAQLKRDHQKELDAVDEEWARKFDEKSDQVDQKYQEFNARVGAIVQKEQQEKAQLQDQITQLQKTKIDTEGQVKTRDFRIKELISNIDDLKQKISELEATNSDLEDQIGKRSVEVNVVQGNLTAAERRLEAAKKENDTWKEEISKAQASAVASLEKTQKNMNEIVSDLNSRLADAEKEHQFTKVKYSASLQRQRALERNNADLGEQNKVLLARIKKLENQGQVANPSVPSFGNDFPKV